MSNSIVPPVKYNESQWEHALHFQRDNGQRVEMVVTHVSSKESIFSVATYRTKNNPNMTPTQEVNLSMEEARYLRALLNRPEVLEYLDDNETEQGDGTALSLFYNAATIRKLERLAQATAYSRGSFGRLLDFLRFCAFILVAVDQQAYQARLDTLEDAGLFALELSKAGDVIREEIADFVNNPENPIEPQILHEEDRPLQHFWGMLYYLSDSWFERRAKLLERGKGPLLSRFVAMLARKHYAQRQ